MDGDLHESSIWWNSPRELRDVVYTQVYVNQRPFKYIWINTRPPPPASEARQRLAEKRAKRLGLALPAEKQKPALFVLRFLVSKLWYDEARDAFFARTTPWTASVFGFTLVNEVAANVTRAAIRIVCVRCLELFMNEPHTFPRLRDLHLKVETDMLEEIGLDVWDKGLTEEDIRACRLSAWTSKMHQLRNLIIDFEMADSYLVGAEARGQCSANLAIIRKTWTKMLFEGQQEHQPVPASSASDADSKLAIGTHDVVVPDTPLPDSSPATPLAHRSIKVNAACSPRQSFAPRRSSTENLRIVQEC